MLLWTKTENVIHRIQFLTTSQTSITKHSAWTLHTSGHPQYISLWPKYYLLMWKYDNIHFWCSYFLWRVKYLVIRKNENYFASPWKNGVIFKYYNSYSYTAKRTTFFPHVIFIILLHSREQSSFLAQTPFPTYCCKAT